MELLYFRRELFKIIKKKNPVPKKFLILWGMELSRHNLKKRQEEISGGDLHNLKNKNFLSIFWIFRILLYNFFPNFIVFIKNFFLVYQKIHTFLFIKTSICINFWKVYP